MSQTIKFLLETFLNAKPKKAAGAEDAEGKGEYTNEGC